MTNDEKFYCTDLAWELGVPLVGTATRGEIWFLIEYAGRWGVKAFEESGIPAQIKAYIQAAANDQYSLRILLIRQAESRKRAAFSFFVGQTLPVGARLYRYYFEKYEDILKLNLADLALGKPGDEADLSADPVYLVCTNGKRDQCCALYGPAVYNAMADVAGAQVWQSSHIGGHNQAPIALFFPEGLNYGHLTPSEARRLVEAHQQGQIVLHHYRGRVGLPNHLQAAEHFWREQKGVLALSGVSIQSQKATGPHRWAVTVGAADGTQLETIHIEQRESDFSIPITCSKKKESKIFSFHRVSSKS